MSLLKVFIQTFNDMCFRYGYQITYSAYGNSEEVPLEYIRQVPQRVSSIESNTVIPIPAHLKILPTDTEEVMLTED